MRRLPLLLCLMTVAGSLAAQSVPRTRAEVSNFEETSRHADVIHFLRSIEPLSRRLHLTHFGYSLEGRELPLAVFGDVEDASASSVLAANKLRVFVQANIHAGEVCGKEAMQMLLRQLALGEHTDWRDSMVLLVAPIYNADGNERVQLSHRRLQNGPHAGMGQRPNAQGLDLNRDHMKVESPEARSLIRLIKEYDPHVAIDLHTTNGSYHGYHLTYSPPLNPNTHVAIDEFLRASLLPSITDRIRDLHGWEFYYYGNAPRSNRGNRPRGWYTFDHRPRFNNNYVGLRNRIAILSEAYSYATFEDRVLASYWFVEEVLNYLSAHASTVRSVVEEAESAAIVGSQLAVRSSFPSQAISTEILMGDVKRLVNPFDGKPYLQRLDVKKSETMPEFGRFVSVEDETVPWAYVVPGELAAVVALLETHGVKTDPLAAGQVLSGQQFRIRTTSQQNREFQGHRERIVEGAYESGQQTVAAGSVVVNVNQPLGRLAFYLLEARSDDGVVNWNMLDKVIKEGQLLPIIRVMEETRLR